VAMERFRKEFDVYHGSFDTIFENDCLFLINNQNSHRQRRGMRVKVKYFFDINLDTQIVSYIDKLVVGKELDLKIKDVAKLFIQKRSVMSTVSISPYIVENSLFHQGVPEDVKRSIYNFFSIIYANHLKNTRIARKRADDHAKRIITFDQSGLKNSAYWVLRRMYSIIYASFLKIYLVQTSITGYKDKVLEFIRFMTDDLQKISSAEMILALSFFKSGQKIGFFGKFQRRNTNIIRDIKNSAWDAFHLRSMEYVMLFHKQKKADLTIPFFYSIDRRLNEIRQMIKLKMIILDYDSMNYYPFYANDIIQTTIKEFHLESKFTIDQSRIRYDSYSVENTQRLIKEMEIDISKQI
jgi:hypothetical protein